MIPRILIFATINLQHDLQLYLVSNELFLGKHGNMSISAHSRLTPLNTVLTLILTFVKISEIETPFGKRILIKKRKVLTIIFIISIFFSSINLHWVNLTAPLFRKKVQLNFFYITDSTAFLQGGVLRNCYLRYLKSCYNQCVHSKVIQMYGHTKHMNQQLQ